MPGIAQRVAQLVRRMMPRPPIVPMTPAQLAELTLRGPTPADVPPLAKLHVATFNETRGGPFGAQRQPAEDGTFGGRYGWPDLNVLAERLA